jgi:Tfp pilus assembly protein PilF
MMGMMLEELPWVLGGDRAEALRLLQRAVAADPSYEHARLDLAKTYLKRQDTAAARRELERLVQNETAGSPSRYAREARTLLDQVTTGRGTPAPARP